MLQLDYIVVDVFTETALSGNPLAVVMNTCGLATERMQAIAREFNLSETTFVERRAPEVERAEACGCASLPRRRSCRLPASYPGDRERAEALRTGNTAR